MKHAKNILVTGGAGYIGSHTVVELIERGYNPIIADDFRNSDPRAIEGIQAITGKYPELKKIDVTDIEQLRSVFEQYEFSGVIHFAAYKAVGESVEKPLFYYKNNVGGLLNCIELAEEFDVPNFVFSSSCTIYGDPKDSVVVTEDSPLQEANSPYGATKQMCERIIDDVHKSGSQLRLLNLRYFNPVGAHSSSEIGELPLGKPNNLLPFVTQTGAGVLGELTVFGNDYNTPDGTCIRDYIHVVDLAIAHIKGFEWLDQLEEPQLETVNVGTGKGVSVLEVIDTFENISKQKLKWKFGERRAGDVEQIYANVTKAKDLLGWKAIKSIEDAVRDAWNWELKMRNE
ncbi:MAG: UDP-glucose 4-epimerase GalE [Crocinitomicaceae bacterium]|nr:UDP-glucose 4-epimerase GalE [Crocinitomicaceae bacterium]